MSSIGGLSHDPAPVPPVDKNMLISSAFIALVHCTWSCLRISFFCCRGWGVVSCLMSAKACASAGLHLLMALSFSASVYLHLSLLFFVVFTYCFSLFCSLFVSLFCLYICICTYRYIYVYVYIYISRGFLEVVRVYRCRADLLGQILLHHRSHRLIPGGSSKPVAR